MKYYQKLVLFIILGLGTDGSSPVLSQPVQVTAHPKTGALTEIKIMGDERDMNWVLKFDGTQNKCVSENYGWGLGFLTKKTKAETVERRWGIPEKSVENGIVVSYKEGNIRIDVKREMENNDYTPMTRIGQWCTT